MILNRQQLKKQIEENDLISEYIDLETQITPNGFDFTVDKIEKYQESGKLDFSNAEREIPESKEIKPVKKNKNDDYGWWDLEKGVYKIKTNERVNIPDNLIGYAFPRSSLLRMGATIENGVWDTGYSGKSTFMLIVENPEGIEIKENARVNHITFMELEKVEEGYQGRYNN